SGGMTRVFIGGGREMGMRPQDIVGAITGEAGIRGSEIGVITISDRFTLVEVAEGLAEDVIQALQDCRMKGKKLTVRLERGGPPPGGPRTFKAAHERRPPSRAK
ncbi:MAG: DbpA RNA binding domain-containing protein, partial [Candidatus Binatia bacterium]